MWNSLNLTFTFISVGISCSRCSFTQTTHSYLCALYHSVLICVSVLHLDHLIHFRFSSSLLEAHVEQHWSLFVRLCGSELCCLTQSDKEAGGFKAPTTPWRDMNYSHASFSHTRSTPMHNKLS